MSAESAARPGTRSPLCSRLALGETSVHAASAAALPASGVTAHAALDALPAAEWQDALDAIFPGASDAQTAPALRDRKSVV